MKMVKKSKELAVKAAEKAEKLAKEEAAAKAAAAPVAAAQAVVDATTGGAKPSPKAKVPKTDVLAGVDITDDADVVFK